MSSVLLLLSNVFNVPNVSITLNVSNVSITHDC